MDSRNGAALIVGVALAIVWCALMMGAGFGAGALLILAFVLSPLVVSLVARTWLLVFALVPNLIIGLFVSVVGAFSSYNRTADGEFSNETFLIVPIVLGLSVGCAIIVTAVVWFFRTALSKA